MTEELQLFLEKNVPKGGKGKLGVGDQKLAATISDSLGYNCTWTGVVPEIIRGIWRLICIIILMMFVVFFFFSANNSA